MCRKLLTQQMAVAAENQPAEDVEMDPTIQYHKWAPKITPRETICC